MMTAISLSYKLPIMDDTKLERYDFHSGIAGKNLVVLGAIHGNEKCGTIAIRKVMAEIESGEIKLISGKVIFLPICNPRAYAQNLRFMERNLNRYLVPKENKVHYEDYLDEQICGALGEADYLLDLHSYHSEGSAFIFLGYSNAENDFARALGVNDFVYGWGDAFAASADANPNESIGATDSMRMHGGMGVTLECGQHENFDAPEIGHQGILRAMNFLGIISQAFEPAEGATRCVKMQSVFYKKKAGALARNFLHYDAVKAGDVLAIYSDGEEILAEKDGYIVLPKTYDANEKIGAEWFYFGVGTEFPKL
jgi:predicted deacylase